jgi:hypothetical protein
MIMCKTIKCSISDVQESCNGGCLACGEIQYGEVEPDARKYSCESCGANQVYGLEELVMMGAITLSDSD